MVLLVSLAVACPEGWSCANHAAARGSEWRVVTGEVVRLEEIHVRDGSVANATYAAVTDFAEDGGATYRVDMTAIPASRFVVHGQRVDLAFEGADAVAMRNTADPMPAARGSQFDENDLSTMTPTTYRHSRTTTMSVRATMVSMGSAQPPCSASEATTLMTSTSSASVRRVYQAVSDGNVQLSVTMSGSINIGEQPNNCDYNSWVILMDQASNWASDRSRYNYRWYFLPKKACGWAGLAHTTSSCTECWSLNNMCLPMVPTHEGGHNQGLDHSGEHATYDDASDYMGNANEFRLMNAVKKLRKGFVLPQKIVWNPSYGVFRLTSLDEPYKSATYAQVMLFQQNTGAVTLALRSQPNPIFALPTAYRNRVNVVEWKGKESRYLGSAGVAQGSRTSIPGTASTFSVGRVDQPTGYAKTAYVMVCNGANCPPYRFQAACENGAAVQKCVYNGKYYPTWYCYATGSPAVPSQSLGTGKSCVNVVSGGDNPTADPTGGAGSTSGSPVPAGRCGASFGGALCPSSTPCCSASGYCGSSASQCSLSTGCQSGCWPPSANVVSECTAKQAFARNFLQRALDMILCVAREASGFDTSVVTTLPNGVRAYGILGIPAGEWCSTGTTAGGKCNVRCSDLLGPSTLAASSSCAVRIASQVGFGGLPAYAANKAKCDAYLAPQC